MASIPWVTVGGLTLIISGEVIIILHQCACHGKNKTIHSSPQIEHYKNKLDNRSIKACSSQRTTTLDNHKVPTSVRNSLTFISLRPHTNFEWEKTHHIILTSDKDWDPTVLYY